MRGIDTLTAVGLIAEVGDFHAFQAARRAQLRPSGRWAHLDARRAKRHTTAAVAVARELACLVWEIARQSH